MPTFNFIENKQMLKTQASIWGQSHIAADFTIQCVCYFLKASLCHQHTSSANLQKNEEKNIWTNINVQC